MTTGATLELDARERSMLQGDEGAAMQLAMQLIVTAAEVTGATELVPIEMAHINSCHYSGRMSLDFAEFLLAEGATLAVPTHTNASLISCTSPALRPESASPDQVAGARRVMEIYERLGCSPMWTCAPYQQPEGRPSLGQHIAGSESNAVGFFNSALGARTNKYGDLLDVAAAIVGRVPLAGLHTDSGRRATHLFDLSELDPATLRNPNFPHLLGTFLGRVVGTSVGVIDGITGINGCMPLGSEDELKALVAAAAAAGGVGLIHIVGVTPEATTFEDATQGIPVSRCTTVRAIDLDDAARLLTSAIGDETLRAVCLGTPHFSVDEFEQTVALLDGRSVADSVTMIVTTNRAVANELALRGLNAALVDAGVSVVLDTCTYFTPRPAGVDGLTMTNSAKWAYYAQGLLEVPVAFASLERCVESAVAGAWLR